MMSAKNGMWAIFALFLTAYAASKDPGAEEQAHFIRKIFNLYGDRDHLSFEGFEHLMESLGLGRVKFDINHSLSDHIQGDRFVEVHDIFQYHVHNHSQQQQWVELKESNSQEDANFERKKRGLPVQEGAEENCLTAEELLQLYGLEPNHRVAISPVGFMQICPAIVYQLDRKACSPRHHNFAVTLNGTRHILSQVGQNNASATWIGATVSIFIISAAGLCGVCVVPILERALFKNVLSSLVALAVGTLCGDALIHLLPHAYGISDDQHAIIRSMSTFFVIMVYFVVESAIYISSRKKKCKKEKYDSDPDYIEVQSDSDHTSTHGDHHVHTDHHGHSHHTGNSNDGIGATAWMVISGDGLHNLTDGLAVGAAFRADLVSGIATAIAVLTHELPHELGDFAVLLKSGMTVRQAVIYNVVSSVLAFIGMVGGVLLGEIHSAITWIYCITAGSFLYIALATLIPELHRAQSDGSGNLILQLIGMSLGGLIMFLLAFYEHKLEGLINGSAK